MHAGWYQKVYKWFTARPAALQLLRAACRGLPLFVAVMYVLLCVYWGAAVAAGGGTLLGELCRAVLVPGLTLVGGTLLRHVLNVPRPYEAEGLVPLVEKDKAGHSFPSRHALSAAVIAVAWWRAIPAVGVFLAVIAAAVCVSRVLAGVHTLADVAAGAALGALCGMVGMFVI